MAELLRYTDFDKLYSRQDIQNAQSICNKAKINWNPKKFVDGIWKTSKNPSDDLCKELMRVHGIKTKAAGELRIKLYRLIMSYWDCLTRDSYLSLAIDQNTDYYDVTDDGFDKNVWKRIEQGQNIKVEFKSAIGEGKDAGLLRVCCEWARRSEPDRLNICVDMCTLPGKTSTASLKDFHFGAYPVIYIKTDENYLMYMEDPDPNKNTETVIHGDKEKKVRIIDPSTLRLQECGGAGEVIGLLVAQSAIKRYFAVMDSVEVVKRESTAERRVTAMHAEHIHVAEPHEGREDVRYTPLSKYAVKYVREKKEWQGGHHASPIPHDVRAHERTLKNGKVIKIAGYSKPCLKYSGNKNVSNVIVVDK